MLSSSTTLPAPPPLSPSSKGSTKRRAVILTSSSSSTSSLSPTIPRTKKRHRRSPSLYYLEKIVLIILVFQLAGLLLRAVTWPAQWRTGSIRLTTLFNIDLQRFVVLGDVSTGTYGGSFTATDDYTTVMVLGLAWASVPWVLWALRRGALLATFRQADSIAVRLMDEEEEEEEEEERNGDDDDNHFAGKDENRDDDQGKSNDKQQQQQQPSTRSFRANTTTTGSSSRLQDKNNNITTTTTTNPLLAYFFAHSTVISDIRRNIDTIITFLALILHIPASLALACVYGSFIESPTGAVHLRTNGGGVDVIAIASAGIYTYEEPNPITSGASLFSTTTTTSTSSALTMIPPSVTFIGWRWEAIMTAALCAPTTLLLFFGTPYYFYKIASSHVVFGTPPLFASATSRHGNTNPFDSIRSLCCSFTPSWISSKHELFLRRVEAEYATHVSDGWARDMSWTLTSFRLHAWAAYSLALWTGMSGILSWTAAAVALYSPAAAADVFFVILGLASVKQMLWPSFRCRSSNLMAFFFLLTLAVTAFFSVMRSHSMRSELTVDTRLSAILWWIYAICLCGIPGFVLVYVGIMGDGWPRALVSERTYQTLYRKATTAILAKGGKKETLLVGEAWGGGIRGSSSSSSSSSSSRSLQQSSHDMTSSSKTAAQSRNNNNNNTAADVTEAQPPQQLQINPPQEHRAVVDEAGMEERVTVVGSPRSTSVGATTTTMTSSSSSSSSSSNNNATTPLPQPRSAWGNTARTGNETSTPTTPSMQLLLSPSSAPTATITTSLSKNPVLLRPDAGMQHTQETNLSSSSSSPSATWNGQFLETVMSSTVRQRVSLNITSAQRAVIKNAGIRMKHQRWIEAYELANHQSSTIFTRMMSDFGKWYSQLSASVTPYDDGNNSGNNDDEKEDADDDDDEENDEYISKRSDSQQQQQQQAAEVVQYTYTNTLTTTIPPQPPAPTSLGAANGKFPPSFSSSSSTSSASRITSSTYSAELLAAGLFSLTRQHIIELEGKWIPILQHASESLSMQGARPPEMVDLQQLMDARNSCVPHLQTAIACKHILALSFAELMDGLTSMYLSNCKSSFYNYPPLQPQWSWLRSRMDARARAFALAGPMLSRVVLKLVAFKTIMGDRKVAPKYIPGVNDVFFLSKRDVHGSGERGGGGGDGRSVSGPSSLSLSSSSSSSSSSSAADSNTTRMVSPFSSLSSSLRNVMSGRRAVLLVSKKEGPLSGQQIKLDEQQENEEDEDKSDDYSAAYASIAFKK